jgi:hypothetical protein
MSRDMTVAAAPAGYANVQDWIDSSFALHTEAAGQIATASLHHTHDRMAGDEQAA